MPQTRPHLVTLALLVGTFLSALDVNVVGTSLPTIVGRLGGLSLYGWVFSAYLLASTTTVPLYGRLADVYGRKPIYLVAVSLFLLGSLLCGTAGSMIALILYRGLQGLGAGGVLPITITLFGDLYRAEKRAFVQGLFSTVWGTSSVLGPLVGGFLVTHVSWRWVFWVNLPLGLLATAILVFTLHERREGEPTPLRPFGALLLCACLTALLLGLQGLQSADHRPWGVGLALAALALGALLVRSEHRSPAPIIPPELFRYRAVVITSAAGLAVGGLLFALVAYIPLFVQGVLHGTPTQAGLALVPLSVLWTLSTFATGRLCRRFGYRAVIVAAGLLAIAGAAALIGAWRLSTPALRHLAMALIGAGMGLHITPVTIAVQDQVGWAQRGVATSLLQFFRTIGGMIAVTVLGMAITARFAAALPPSTPLGAAELLDPERWGTLPPALLERAGQALSTALGPAFYTMAALATVVFVVVLAFPRLRMQARG